MFSNLGQTLDLLSNMAPALDSKLLVLFSGIIVSFLEMHGYANPSNHSQNLDAWTQILGAIITIVTIVSYYVHNAVLEKNRLKYAGQTTPVTDPTAVATVPENKAKTIKKFVFKEIGPSQITNPPVNPPATQPLPQIGNTQ